MNVRALFWTLVDSFRENNVLTYASAISFQLLVALVPLAALTLLLMGLADAGDLWYDRGQGAVPERVTPEVFLAVSDAISRVLTQQSLIWVALALALTIWEVSGSVRAVMGALNRIYEAEEDRSIWRRFGLSFLLASGVIVLVIGALALVAFGGPVFWPAAVVMLWLTIVMLIRVAPATRVEVRWATIGSVLVIVSWIAASLAYGLYVRSLADFESTFGFVVAGLLLTGYLYASSIVFLAGAQIDELLRERTTPAGRRRGRAGGA
jgi:membrane protein